MAGQHGLDDAADEGQNEAAEKENEEQKAHQYFHCTISTCQGEWRNVAALVRKQSAWIM